MSERIWKETVSPKYLHDTIGVYNGDWMPKMDRCWNSNDGLQVMSRIIITDWGKVEHATIMKITRDENRFSQNGERDFSWKEKQEIKNELFGEDRLAIEVFPKSNRLVDVMDVYHLWVFPKDFDLPFGIHPKDKRCNTINRGTPNDVSQLVQNFLWAKQFLE